MISKATLEDKEKIKKVLAACSLPFQDIDPHLENFLIAKREQEITGIVGMEVYGEYALLRSFAVSPSSRNKGLGKELLWTLIRNAKQKGIKEFYLLTETARDYFEKNGFMLIERSKAPTEIQQTLEFKSVCPSSAYCMMASLDHFSEEVLETQYLA